MTEQKTIIFFVDSLSLGSGVISYIINNCLDIDKEFNYIFFVRLWRKESYDQALRAHGCKIIYLNNKLRPIKYAKLKNIMIKNRNAIMHAHSSVYALPLFMLARRCGIKKLILHSHSTKFSSSRVKDLISKVLSEIAILYATDYWACSEEAALYMFGKNRGKSVQIMKNGIDFARFRYSVKEREEIRNKYGLSGRFVIGHVGRFSEEKNHEFIIRVFKEAKERNKEALLLLVGNGTKYNNIRKICMENQVINDVLFIGFSNNVSSLLSSMDVFLFPSIHEGLPIALLEAQANGLPCIASDQITKDVKISNHLEFMSLNQSISDWATKILDAKREFKEVEELSHLFDSIYTRMQTLERYREILSRSS